MKWMFQMGRGGKAVQVSGSHGRLTEARTEKKGMGKKFRGTRRVRGPRVTRATTGYPERDSSRYILNGVSFNDCSHMFEFHWDYIQDPTQHPDVDPTAKYYVPMCAYSRATASMDFSDFLPRPDVEASEKSQRVSSEGALSRRCPVQDATDYWSSPEDQAQEECVTVLLGFAPAPDVHNVDTGAGDPVLNPT
jgi:hypothetical protein